MMKPRELVPFLTVCSDKPTLEETVNDLRSELRRTQAQLTEESRQRAMAEANVARMKRNMQKPPAIPYGDTDYGYECGAPNCACELSTEYKFCPSCGCEIDWRTWVASDTSTNTSYERNVETLMSWGRMSGQVHR